MRILVFTTDVIPLAGFPTSGTALRTFGLIQGLKTQGHEVIVSVPKQALAGFRKNADLASLPRETQELAKELSHYAFDSSNQVGILAEVNPDAIIFGHWPCATLSIKPSQISILDLAGPHLLERHYQSSSNQIGAILGKNSVIGSADYYIVSGPSQRLYFLSFMLRAKVPNPEARIVTIPMPLDPNIPKFSREFTADQFPRFIFGGVFLPWQNPAHGLQTLSAAIKRRNKGSLKLIGGKHPNYKIQQGLYTKLFEDLAENSFVKTKPMLPYPEFVSELGEADVALDLMKWNLERELAMTIRSTTYLWAGLPIIYNDYADLGRLISQYDAGWCIPPEDGEKLEEVLEEIYDNPGLVASKSENAQRLAKEVFAWDKAVLPLLNFLGKSENRRLRETDIIVDFPDSADLYVSDSQAVEQYFLCRIDGLSRIECRLATHGKKIEKPIRLNLFELEEEYSPSAQVSFAAKRRLVASATGSNDNVVNNEWFSLDVPPVPNSAGRAYVLQVEGQHTSAESHVSPWAIKGSPFPLLALRHGSRTVEDSCLCLRTTCAGNL